MTALALALAGQNVAVPSGAGLGRFEREPIAKTLTEGGSLTRDPATVRAAARAMLAAVLSCRETMSNSGTVARVAGDAIGASLHLPTMATEGFLACLSKPGVEKAAAAEGVRVGARAKDTRAALIERFASGAYVYPGALVPSHRAGDRRRRTPASYRYVPGSGDDDGDSFDGSADGTDPVGTGDDAGSDDTAIEDNADTPAIAAE